MARKSAVVGLLAAASGAVAWAVVPAGVAQADAPYTAGASTDAATVTISNESIPAGIEIEGGGPAVRVRQSSLGIRDANASLPYTGDTVPGLPGLGASLFGFTAPPYPFVASTTAGSAPQNVDYPGVSVRAESDDYSTRATSTAGQPGSGATAVGRVDEERVGDVVATASTIVDSIKLGPYGVVSDIRTVATASADGATGKLTRTTSSSIGHISVPGLVFTVPKQSPAQIPIPIPVPGVPNQAPIAAPPFPFPGGGTTFHDPDLGIQDGFFTVTVPNDGTHQKYAVPAQTVLDALSARGITLRFQAPQETKTGVIAGAFIMQYTIPTPPQNSYYNGPTTVTQTTAHALATVDLHPAPVAPATTGLPLPPLATGNSGAISTPAVATGAIPSPALEKLPVTVPAAPATETAAVPRTVAFVPVAGRLTSFQVGPGVDSVYLSVLGLALAGFAAAGAVAWLGVRSK